MALGRDDSFGISTSAKRLGSLFGEGFSLSGHERDAVWLNDHGINFIEVSAASGADDIGDARGAAFADIDNDGDTDVILVSLSGAGNPFIRLYRNDLGHRQGYLRLTLRGRESGREAFGAVVRVKTSRGIQTKLKSGSSGFLSQHDPRLLFGLGADTSVQSIEVTWPSGKKSSYGGAAAGDSLLLIEGETRAQPIQEKQFSLPAPWSANNEVWSEVKFRRGSILANAQISNLDKSQTSLYEVVPRGKAALVNVWATWCESCRAEIPSLQKLAEKYETSLQVVGISVDEAEDFAKIPSTLARLGATYPNYFGGLEFLRSIASEETPFPLTILLDRNGQVVDVYIGYSRTTLARLHRRLAQGLPEGIW